MFSFLFIYTLKNREDRDSFLAELNDNSISEICNKEVGCNMYKYLLSEEEPTKIYIVESWTDEEAQKLHCKQPHCNIIRSLKEKYGVESSSVIL